MLVFTCPSCGEKQTNVRQWQTVSIAYNFDLGSNHSDGYKTDNIEGGDHESWNCLDCGEEIKDKSLINKISNQLFGT